MKTKQELEKEIWNAMVNGCQLDSDLREDSESAVIDCSNIAIEFSKEVAIDFGRWVMKNGYKLSLATEHIYDLYLKTKANEQQH